MAPVLPATYLMASASFFRLQSGSAGAGNITLTVTDSQTGSSCMITDVVVDPGACSQQEPAVTVTITDPCSCNNDASLAGNDGTFGEEITVTGPAGPMLQQFVPDVLVIPDLQR